MLITSDALEAQLVEVLRRLGLRPEGRLDGARCGECNGELEPVSVDEVAEQVPPYVRRTAERFSRCCRCRRVYWPGSHSERIVRTMGRVVAALGNGSAQRKMPP
jgi:uncharacterized protein with PIN domain